MRVFDADGNPLGILTLEEALQEAQDADLDLVEVSPKAQPPVAKIIDYGKFCYQKEKEQRTARKNSPITVTKQMRLRPNIGDNDLAITLRKIKTFLEDGKKVKVVVAFKGREITHQELGTQLLKKVIESLKDVAVVEQEPEFSGKSLSLLLRKLN